MKKRNVILLLILTILILYFNLKNNFIEVLNAILNVNIFWIIISYLLVLSYTFLKSVTTQNIINKFNKMPFRKTFLIQMVTFFFNAVTPFSSGGQPFQVYMFNKSGNSIIDSTNIVIEETIIHQISLVLVGFLTLLLNLFFNVCKLNKFLYIILILGFCINVIIIVLLLIISNAKKLDKILINLMIKFVSFFKKVDNQEKIYNSIEKFNTNSKILLKDKYRFIKLVCINSFALICLYLVPLTLLFSFNDYTSFNGFISIVIVSFTSIISSFIPLPGGVVGQEYIFKTLFSSYINDPLLSTLMIIWRFITYFLPLIVGAIIFNLKQKQFLHKKF